MPSLAWLKVFRIPHALPRRLYHRPAPRLPASRRHEGGYHSRKGHPPSLRQHLAPDQLAAAMAHARAMGPSNRLVELNRIFVTCDLNRLGGFYRFCGPSLDQNTERHAPPRTRRSGKSNASVTRSRTARRGISINVRSPRLGPRTAQPIQWDTGVCHLPDVDPRVRLSRPPRASSGRLGRSPNLHTERTGGRPPSTN